MHAVFEQNGEFTDSCEKSDCLNNRCFCMFEASFANFARIAKENGVLRDADVLF